MMTKRIEDEIREQFQLDAEGFEMDGTLPPRVRRRARTRAMRTLSAVVVVSLAGGALSVVTLRGHPSGPARSPAAPAVRLLDYTGDPTDADGSALEQHAQCMRDQGFDVPNPVRTDTGWEVTLPPSIDRSSPAWQEAEFVTCALSKFLSGPPPANLVFAAPTPTDVQAFLDCMRGQGFDLPEPTQDADGAYRIDLSTTSIDTSSDAWNRALLITCAPPVPVGPSGPSGGPSGPSGG
jgi:hypothetical protein